MGALDLCAPICTHRRGSSGGDVAVPTGADLDYCVYGFGEVRRYGI